MKTLPLHSAVKSHGKSRKPSNIEEIEAYISDKYDLRFNVVTNTVEFRLKGDITYIPMTDFMENSIYCELLRAGIKCQTASLNRILNSDYSAMFDPFISYFDALPKWDGVTDHISNLADTVTTTNPSFWKMAFTKWIVAMVANLQNTEKINHAVLTLSGPQGIGKSTWLENLVPPQLKQNHLFSGTIDPDNKDSLTFISECMLIHLDEFESLTRLKIASLKALITKRNIRNRRVWGRNNESRPRRASFCSSVNTAKYLNDTTGNRRFLSFEVTLIDYSHKVDINLVMSQALALFKSGFKYWFDGKDIEEINSNNEQFEVITQEEELLLSHFEKPEEGTAPTWLTATEIVAAIVEKTPFKSLQHQTMGRILSKLGFERAKKAGRWRWGVKESGFRIVKSPNENLGG